VGPAFSRISPIEPLINAAARPGVWARTLAILADRAM
jgi:hypothetical protein